MNKVVTLLLFYPLLHIASTDSLVDCEFERNFCSWKMLGKDYDFLQIEKRLCGFSGEIENCRSTNFIASARHWLIASFTNNTLLLQNIPQDLKDKAKTVAYSDNTHSHQYITTLFQQDFTTSLLYSPTISASHSPRCLKYRYLLTGKAHILVSYLTAFDDDIYSGTPLIAHAPLDPYNFTYGFINMPFINDIRIQFRAVFLNELDGIAVLDYVRLLDGFCIDTCPGNSFTCDNSECIPPEQICDEHIDCSDRSDEKFCYKTSKLNCSGITFPNNKSDFDDVREINENITVQKVNALSTECISNDSEQQESMNLTVRVRGVCFLDEGSSPHFNTSLSNISLDLNGSDFIFCTDCSSDGVYNSSTISPVYVFRVNKITMLVLSLNEHQNFTLEYFCDHFTNSDSRTIRKCIEPENQTDKCSLAFCTQCWLSSFESNNFSNVILNDSMSIWKENVSAVLISCDYCSELANSSVQNLYGVCTLDVVTENIFPIPNNFSKCDGCENVNVSSLPGGMKNTSSNINIGTNCGDTDASTECSKRNTEGSSKCHPFCPSRCNCSAVSYICVKQECPAFAERIVLQNVECDRVDVSDFKTKHIFKLEILNTVIRILEMNTVENYSVHSILIKDSSIVDIDIGHDRSILKSIHIVNTTLSSFVGSYFTETGKVDGYTSSTYFSLGKKKLNSQPPYHLVRVIILLQPQILDISENTFENMLPMFIMDFDDIVNASHNKLINADEISSRVVDLSYNKLTAYSHSYSSVEVLYLNNNCLQSARRAKYLQDQDDNLRTVDLSYNYITVIYDGDLLSSNLIYLNLSRNRIHTIEAGAFSITTSLITLDLSYNEISQIIDGTFSPLGDLVELFLQGNPFHVVEGMFTGLHNLRIIQVRHYTICCAKPNSKHKVNCIAPSNEVSSCKNLIASPIINVAIWYIALIAVSGNVTVLLFHIINFKNKRAGANNLLIMNLSLADLLMGIYLFVTAITNLHYTGKYGLNDHVWRHSMTCIVSGIIAILSSEVSAFIIFLITLERYIVVKYPVSDFKLTRKGTILFLIFSWTLSLLLSLIPLVPEIDLDKFYTQSGVCISLPLSVARKSGWKYSMIVFVGINFLLFLGIIVGQMAIFITVISADESIHSMKLRQKEASLAMSLFAIVSTDVLCWTPIGAIGMLTFLGIEVQADVYAWMILVVLPINSALNPILYSLTASIRNKKNKHEKVAQLKKELFQLKSTRRE